MLFFYSEDMEKQLQSHGYYYISVKSPNGHKLLKSNNERAFVISQLQDILSPRPAPHPLPEYQQFSSYIDLLGFSIQADAIQFITFGIDYAAVKNLTTYICERLATYQSEYEVRAFTRVPVIHIEKLRGPHQALEKTVSIHSCHTDWEYDRYSSIGFYLHDRRGDWMRVWRLTSLFDHDPVNYHQLMQNRLETDSPLSAYSSDVRLMTA